MMLSRWPAYSAVSSIGKGNRPPATSLDSGSYTDAFGANTMQFYRISTVFRQVGKPNREIKNATRARLTQGTPGSAYGLAAIVKNFAAEMPKC